VAQSSAEAEYKAMSNTASEFTCLQHFLREIGFTAPTPIPLLCDNQVAIHIASNFVFPKRTKHIEVDCHFVQYKILNVDISAPFVKSGN
jgi:hypothetical protein